VRLQTSRLKKSKIRNVYRFGLVVAVAALAGYGSANFLTAQPPKPDEEPTATPSLLHILGVSVNDAVQDLLLREALAKAKTDPVLRHYMRPSDQRAPGIAPLLIRNPKLEEVPTEALVDGVNHARAKTTKPRFKHVRDVTSSVAREQARSVCAIIDQSGVRPDTIEGVRGWHVKTTKLRDKYDFCKKDDFYEQPVAAGIEGTAFLVTRHLVATAGHLARCDPTQLYFVFDFMLKEDEDALPVETFEGKAGVFYDESRVRRGVCLKGFLQDSRGSDWAIFNLDKPIDRPPVTRTTVAVGARERLYSLGHPFGLPMQYVEGRVTENDVTDVFFMTDLDTYPHHSGAPVFNGGDKAVGIHRAGSRDKIIAGEGCRFVNLYATGTSSSKEVRIDEIAFLLIGEEALITAKGVTGFIRVSRGGEVKHMTIDSGASEAIPVGSGTSVRLLTCSWKDEDRLCEVMEEHAVKPGEKWEIRRSTTENTGVTMLRL